MKISGESRIDLPPEMMWPLIFDPQFLLHLIPGCQSIEQVAPEEYDSVIALRVPGITGIYKAHVKVLEYEAPKFCRIQGEVTSLSGGGQGQASFTLIPNGEQTLIQYSGEALISGRLAGLNSRFAEGVVNSLLRQGLARLPALARSGGPLAAANSLKQQGGTEPD